jgi:hypothetical protein
MPSRQVHQAVALLFFDAYWGSGLAIQHLG